MKIITIVLIILISISGYSQEINTLFNSDNKEITFGGYGGPIIRASHVNGVFGIAIGGKGGFTINRSFTFGGIGIGYVSDYSFKGDNFAGEDNVDLHIGMGAGGIFFEYVIGMQKAVHIAIPVNLMAGGISISEKKNVDYDKKSDENVEDSGVFFLEPGINIEFNISKFFMPTLNIAYRFAMGSSLENLSDKDLSGFHVGLEFKFGKF